MRGWWCFWAFVAVFCAVMYLLYRKGIGVSKSIRALLFVFRPGRGADKADLNSCTGWVRHAGRFRAGRTYEFALDVQLSKGDAEVSLLDKRRRTLWTLNRRRPAGRMELSEKGPYYLRWEFRSATGKCTLRWRQQQDLSQPGGSGTL